MEEEPRHPARQRKTVAYWLLALLALNAVLLALGLTVDALTVAKTLTKEVLIWKLRLVDERSTYSIITAIFKLWEDGNYGLFTIVFGFSIMFPIAKLLVNAALIVSTLRPGMETEHHPRIATWLGHLGKWSMIEVFMAALLCVVVKMGDLVRVQIEAGLYLFCAAVLISIICAVATRKIYLNPPASSPPPDPTRVS